MKTRGACRGRGRRGDAGCEAPPLHRHSPALAGRWGRPGDTLFLCSAGCWGDKSRGSVRDDVTRDGVTREPLGLLNCSELWLDTGTVTGMAKLGAGTADWTENKEAGSGRGDPLPWQPKVLSALSCASTGQRLGPAPPGPLGSCPALSPRTDPALGRRTGQGSAHCRRTGDRRNRSGRWVSPQPGGTRGERLAAPRTTRRTHSRRGLRCGSGRHAPQGPCARACPTSLPPP